MICPILSQSHQDDQGSIVWNHHDCIEGACSFWAEEITDCGLRASGLVIIGRARAAAAAQPDGESAGSAPAGEPLFAPPRATLDGEELRPVLDAVESVSTAARETGLKLLEGVAALEEPLKANGRELGGRIDTLNEAVLSFTTTIEGRLSVIEEGLDRLHRSAEDAASRRPPFVTDLEEGLASLNARLGAMFDRIEPMAQHLEALGSQMIAVKTAHEEIAGALQRDSSWRAAEEERRRKEASLDLNSRGVALYYSGSLEAAEASFRAAIQGDEAFAEASNNLGLVLSRQGRAEEAEACFRRALELDPSMAAALNNLGFLFHQGMQFEKAVDMFRRSALTGEEASIAYTNMGSACYKLGRYTEAIDAWKRALEHNPTNESAREALRMFQQEEAGQA